MSSDKELDDIFGVDFSSFETKKEDATEKVLAVFTKSSAPVLAAEEEFEVSEDEINTDEDVIAANNILQEAAKRQAETEAALQATKQEISEVDAAIKDINDQIRALRESMAAFEAKKRDIFSATLDKRRAFNEAQRELDSAQRSIQVVRNNVLTKKKMAATVESFQRIAEKYSWYTGIETPDGKTVKILPHQWEGIKFLANAGRAILGDQMGLGKTIEAIAALDLVGSKRALVICPAEVTSNFLREIKRWAPHRRVVNLHGRTKEDRNTVLMMAAHFEPVVIIVNYEAWRKDLSLLERLIDIQFDTVIADEAHAVKGTNTDAFSGVKRVVTADNVCPYDGSLLEWDKAKDQRSCQNCRFIAGTSVSFADGMDSFERLLLTRSVKNLWMMTGTPILNAPEDLYPMLHLVNHLWFPYKNQYLYEYCMFDYEKNKYVFKSGGLNSLVKRLSGKYLARDLSSAGVVLPPQDIIMHNIEFDDDVYLMQQSIIKQLKKHAQIVLSENNKMSAIGVLALITRLRQANVWPAGIQVWEHPRDPYGIPDKTLPKRLIFDAGEIRESIKLDKVMNLIMEYGVIESNRIAVFSQFKTALAELEDRLKNLGLRVVRFDGDTPKNLKDEIKINFDKSSGEEAKWDIVLCNYKTGGIGLNLTAATHTIILDEEWNPGKRDQAYARTHRMGQDERTFVHLVRLENTVDTWLANLISDKEELIGGFDSATVDIQEQLLKAIKDGEV